MTMLLLIVLGGAMQGANSNPAEAPDDARVSLERFTDTNFTMTPFAGREEWENFAQGLRRRFLVSSGLWPMPERTPLNAKVEEVARHPDYIVERVSIEARPGFLVTGNLYRPVGEGPYPGIACPHGHWEHGRLQNDGKCSVPARCITFARMGMVAFSYDMVGYNDSRQFSRTWGHLPEGLPREVRRREALWGIHPFAIQLWSSIRVLDFLESLPYVDKDRLACTGASGGGTQTFALIAVDPRVKVCAPVNMVSHTMQGGCMCENAPIIRFDASNMEVGALMAPKPMMMVSASGDWTKDTQKVEYPAIKGIYALYGAEDHVENHPVDFGHNYNKESREAVYRFFGKWLLSDAAKWANFTEPAYEMEPVEKLHVFPGDAAPAGYPTADEIIAKTSEADRAKWTAKLPKSPGELEAFRAFAAPALEDIVGAPPLIEKGPDAYKGRVTADHVGEEKRDGYALERLVLHDTKTGSALPALLYTPRGNGARTALRGVALVVHSDGHAALVDGKSGLPGPIIKGLLRDHRAVLTLDAFLVGSDAKRVEKSFPETFLPTDTAYRIQDVLTALAFIRSRAGLMPAQGAIDVIGLKDAGVWCLFAAALDSADRGDGKPIAHVIADINGFDPGDDAAWANGPYMPCIQSIGGASTAAALAAPAQLTLFNGPKEPWTNALAAHAAVTGRTVDSAIAASLLTPKRVVRTLR